MKRAIRIILSPIRWTAFAIGVIFCAIIDGTDAAEDWYTEGKGLGKVVND